MADPLQQPSAPQTDPALALRMLYDEQQRMRSAIEDLRRRQEQSQNEDKKNDDAQSGNKEEGDEKDGENDEKGADQQDDQKDKEGKGNGKDDKEKKEKKPPLRQRVAAWRREHPAGTILIVAATVVVLIAGVFLWRYLDSYENTDDAFIDGHTDPISPRISGIVVASYVENTYRVRKGQVLIELDPRDYEVSLEQSRANLAQAEANLRAQMPNVPITETSQSTQVTNSALDVDSATANLEAARQRYRSALSDLEQAEANAANASREEERYHLLVVKEEVSRELYDQRATQAQAEQSMVAARRSTADAAAKDVSAAEKSLDQARQRAGEARHNMRGQIAIQQQTLAMRRASVEAAHAQADQALLNLQYTKILAPADGIIGDKSVQLGTQVAPGQEMFALTELNDIWVTANFKETQVKRMRPGESVTIHVDALSQNFDGYVEALPGASGAIYSLLPPENATGNYVKVVQRLPVRIRFKPGQPGAERLAPGMSVEPKVWLQ